MLIFFLHQDTIYLMVCLIVLQQWMENFVFAYLNLMHFIAIIYYFIVSKLILDNKIRNIQNYQECIFGLASYYTLIICWIWNVIYSYNHSLLSNNFKHSEPTHPIELVVRLYAFAWNKKRNDQIIHTLALLCWDFSFL